MMFPTNIGTMQMMMMMVILFALSLSFSNVKTVSASGVRGSEREDALFRKTMMKREKKQAELLDSLKMIQEQIENYIHGTKHVDPKRLASIRKRAEVYQELLDEASKPLDDEEIKAMMIMAMDEDDEDIML